MKIDTKGSVGIMPKGWEPTQVLNIPTCSDEDVVRHFKQAKDRLNEPRFLVLAIQERFSDGSFYRDTPIASIGVKDFTPPARKREQLEKMKSTVGDRTHPLSVLLDACLNYVKG